MSVSFELQHIKVLVNLLLQEFSKCVLHLLRRAQKIKGCKHATSVCFIFRFQKFKSLAQIFVKKMQTVNQKEDSKRCLSQGKHKGKVTIKNLACSISFMFCLFIQYPLLLNDYASSFQPIETPRPPLTEHMKLRRKKEKRIRRGVSERFKQFYFSFYLFHSLIFL